MILERLAKIIHETSKEKGFWDGEYNYDKVGNKLALVHSEVTEVLEAIRKSKGQVAIVEEMADVIIRLLDIYQAMVENKEITISIEKVLKDKMEINKKREKLHGNLF